MPAPQDWLDRPLYVLNVGRRGYAPVTWRDAWGLAGLAFADGDLRAREEWLQAVLAAGAELPPPRPRPAWPAGRSGSVDGDHEASR